MPVTDSDLAVGQDARSPGLIPAVLLVASAVPLFVFRMPWLGYPMMLAALAIAWWLERRSQAAGVKPELLRDLSLIAIGMTIVSSVSVVADISWGNFFLLGFVLAAAVAVPYALSRWGFRDHRIRFPWNFRQRWTRTQWIYLTVVIVAGYLILPFYFVSTGVYLNWPEVREWHEIGRLFVGVNAVGTWDELFFVCTVFVLLRRHFPSWQANLLQAVVFVSFLWELGYQAWGPLLTIPFALVQGFTFHLTKSLSYVLVVHLLFDAIVFLVIVSARNPGALPIFLY